MGVVFEACFWRMVKSSKLEKNLNWGCPKHDMDKTSKLEKNLSFEGPGGPKLEKNLSFASSDTPKKLNARRLKTQKKLKKNLI